MLAVVSFIIGAIFVVGSVLKAVADGRRGITSRGKHLHPNQYDRLGLNRAYVAAEDAALAAGKSRREAAKAGRAAEEGRRKFVQRQTAATRRVVEEALGKFAQQHRPKGPSR